MKLIIALVFGITVYIAFNWLVGYIDKIIEDRKLCGDYKVIYVDDVLYCKCDDKINQEPGKCNERYK